MKTILHYILIQEYIVIKFKKAPRYLYKSLFLVSVFFVI